MALSVKCREPQPILLPEVKARYQTAFLPTIEARSLRRVRPVCAGCGYVVEPDDCFCGQCGLQVRAVFRRNTYDL